MKIDYNSAEHINRQINRPAQAKEIAIGAWSLREIDNDLVIINNKTGQRIMLARSEDELLS